MENKEEKKKEKSMSFPPPRVMHILSVVQIMFYHPPSNSHSLTKIDISHLNKKLQTLQKQGMVILGIHFTDLEKESLITIPQGGLNVPSR